MAVKSASDRSAQDAEIRRTRETYQQRENEVAKQQGQQIKKIVENHQAELAAIRADHDEKMQEFKTKTAEMISRRDMKFQKEIDDLRDMHQKQVQRLAYESDSRAERLESSLQSEIKRLKETQGKEEISSLEEQLKAKEKQFEDFAERMRRSQQQGNVDQMRTVRAEHQREINAIVQDRDRRILDQQRHAENFRKAKEQQIRDMESQKANELARMASTMEYAITDERENVKHQLDVARETFDLASRKNQERYRKAADKATADSAEARDSLYRTVNQRLDERIRAKETEIRRLQDEMPRIRVKNEQQKATEIQNVKDSMQATLDELQKQKDEIVDASNEKNTNEFLRLNKQNDKALNSTHKFYQEKIAMEDIRADERMERAKADAQKILQQEKISADARLEKIESFNEIERGKLRAYFERASSAMKETFENSLREVREKSKREQDQLFTQFAKTAQENDVKLQQKIASVSMKHEREMASLQEKHLKEVKDRDLVAERIKREIERKGQTDLKAQASKYEYRIGQLQEQHRREIDELNVKHQESLANLVKNRKT
jgi:hypothetical protein